MKTLVIISQFASILPIAIGIARWRRTPQTTHLLIAILGAWLIAEIIQFITRMNNIHNLWISYALTPVQLVLMGAYYMQLIPNRRKLIFGAFGLGLLIAVIELSTRPVTQLNSVSLLYQCVIIVLIGMIAFYDMLGRANFSFIWSNSAFVILFMGSAVYYTAFLKLDNMDLLKMLSAGHTVLLIIVYGLLTIETCKQ